MKKAAKKKAAKKKAAKKKAAKKKAAKKKAAKNNGSKGSFTLNRLREGDFPNNEPGNAEQDDRGGGTGTRYPGPRYFLR